MGKCCSNASDIDKYQILSNNSHFTDKQEEVIAIDNKPIVKQECSLVIT